jgi:hypothetical protein
MTKYISRPTILTIQQYKNILLLKSINFATHKVNTTFLPLKMYCLFVWLFVSLSLRYMQCISP